MRVLVRAGVVPSILNAEDFTVVFVEVIETPQRDWWVVADGRVVGLYLESPECPEPLEPAMRHGTELSKPYGMSILCVGTTWRSMAFDHLEDLSCRRGTCCRSWFADEDESGEDAM